ncbi:hypothetical protein Ancab_003449 [Ancistrocladus abbreviatus]
MTWKREQQQSLKVAWHTRSHSGNRNMVGRKVFGISVPFMDYNALVGTASSLEWQTSSERNSSPCSFRISYEGLPLLLPYITKQILHASPVDFKHLLLYKSVKFAHFVDAQVGEKASQLMMGCCVVVLREGLWLLSLHLISYIVGFIRQLCLEIPQD